jgi:quinol-cytochrome oxidoreductase complex cytochrome b subunit
MIVEMNNFMLAVFCFISIVFIIITPMINRSDSPSIYVHSYRSAFTGFAVAVFMA